MTLNRSSLTNPLGSKPIKVTTGVQTEVTFVSKKKKALDAIKQTSVHNRDDLILIVSLLQNKLDSFKVLCGCVALERFLEEESRLQALNFHMEKGTVRIEADLATRHECIPNGLNTPYPTIYQQTRSV